MSDFTAQSYEIAVDITQCTYIHRAIDLSKQGDHNGALLLIKEFVLDDKAEQLIAAWAKLTA